MILGVGCDIVEISRIEKLIQKDTALKKLFTHKERELLSKQPNKPQWAAGRFAAKEAVSKALKAGIAKCPPNCVEVLYDENGAPEVSLLGAALKLLEDVNFEIHLSITHDAGIAQAFAVLEEMRAKVKIRDPQTAAMMAKLLPQRKEKAHKGDMGKVAVLAGSKKYSGAGYLCTLSALRGGAGLVTWCRNYEPTQTPPEAISFMLPEKHTFHAFREFCTDMDSVVIGPGLGVEFAKKTIDKVLGKIACPVVLDADALNALAQYEKFPALGGKVILTPHVGEAARLLKKENSYVAENTVKCAKELARITGAVAVIKCHKTVVCSPDGETFINSTGNPGMATGGSGDVLAGLIGALLKRLKPYDAARYAVYLHGLAGDIAKLSHGENSMTALDILEALPQAFMTLDQYNG